MQLEDLILIKILHQDYICYFQDYRSLTRPVWLTLLLCMAEACTMISVSISTCLCVRNSVCASFCYYVSPLLGETYWFCPVRPSVRPSVHPSVHPSVRPSVTLRFRSITGEPFHLECSNFMCWLGLLSRWSLLILGSLAQRSRSHGLEDEKRFPINNWSSSWLSFFKLHMLVGLIE